MKKTKPMTKVEAEKQFRAHVLPHIAKRYERDGRPDRPARRTAWNDFTDGLCKDGRITHRQYETWTHPKWLETAKAGSA